MIVVWFSRAPKYSRLFFPIPNNTLKTWYLPFRPALCRQSIMPSETTHRHWKDGLPIKVSSFLSIRNCPSLLTLPCVITLPIRSPTALESITNAHAHYSSLMLSFISSFWVATSSLSLVSTYVKPLALSDPTNGPSLHIARLQTQADLHHSSKLDIRHLVPHPSSTTWLHILPIHRRG